MISFTIPLFSGSKSDVGSSKMMISGLLNNALAIDTLFFSPPDISSGFSSSSLCNSINFFKFTFSIISLNLSLSPSELPLNIVTLSYNDDLNIKLS